MSEIRMADIPNELLGEIARRLHTYSTAMFRLPGSVSNPDKPLHIGAGTFVSIGSVYGILTATHVVEKLEGQWTLGLLASREGQEHRFTIDQSSLSIITIGNRITDEFGPDAAFIVLGDWDSVSTLSAARAFYKLDRVAGTLLSDPPSVHSGVWFTCGTPGEKVFEEPSQSAFAKVISLESYCAGGGIDRYYDHGDYDYYEFPLVDDNPRRIKNFQGMSGGALWEITLQGESIPDLSIDTYFLMGINFFQDVRPDDTRFLRCHGYKTLYRYLLDKISNAYEFMT